MDHLSLDDKKLSLEDKQLLESITLFSRPGEIKTAEEAQRTTLLIQEHITRFTEELQRLELPRNEVDFRIKEEKIRVAKERLEKAKVAQREVTIHWGGEKAVAGSSNQLEMEGTTDVIIDTTLDAWTVCRHVACKNNLDPELPWSLIVFDSENHIMRTVEDNEIIYELIEYWKARGITTRRLYFRLEDKKYHLFESPASYFSELSEGNSGIKKQRLRRLLIQLSFLTSYYRTTPSTSPTMEADAHIRVGSKKWKKVKCFLRADGIYYEKPKEREPVCYVSFALCKVFETTEFDSAYKAPGLAVVAVEDPASTEDYVKAVCLENRFLYVSWYSAIRMARHSNQLLVNYNMHCMKTEQLLYIKRVAPEYLSKARRRSTTVLDLNSRGASIKIDLQRGADFHLDWSHREQDWFHGKISRDEQQKCFEQLGGSDGLFLVRESSSAGDQCVLVICYKGNILNFLISESDDGYIVGESEPRPTLQQLLDELKKKCWGLPCCLTEHVPRVLARVLLRALATYQAASDAAGDEIDLNDD
ncbi:growth factor receptor-bound protein 10-like [Sycon ciliatum]|uniref:growth factor receptor-bound protein 10-like n=1 Tax=Sycon ciliatum TaxID=27933 RepID=UPI0031F70F4A